MAIRHATRSTVREVEPLLLLLELGQGGVRTTFRGYAHWDGVCMTRTLGTLVAVAMVVTALACGSESGSTADPGESLVESVGAFRSLGFFADEPRLDDAEVLERIQRAYQREWGESIEPDDPLADVYLLAADTGRVWWDDLEADALEGNGVYVDTLKAWGKISRGWFRPRQIREHWAGVEGPVTISYTSSGQRRELRPDWNDAWIDLNLVCQINRTLASNAGELAVVKTFEQTAVVLALTPREREQLEQRGWEFEDTCRAGWLDDFVRTWGP